MILLQAPHFPLEARRAEWEEVGRTGDPSRDLYRAMLLRYRHCTGAY